MKSTYPGSALAAFLIIVLVAPPLGCLGPLTYISIREIILTGNTVTHARIFEEGRITELLLASYMLAGFPALLASIYTGVRIYLTRWVPLRVAVAVAAVLAPLIPITLNSIFGAFEGGHPYWLNSDFLLFALWSTPLSIALAIATALILRVSMLRLKILVPPAKPSSL